MASTKLCQTSITTALTAVAQTEVTGFGKPQAMTLIARFTTTGGGTTCKGRVQTQLDGANWVDIANFAFTTSSAIKYANMNFSAAVAVTAPTSGSIADDTLAHGLLGDKLRVLIDSVGTYNAGSELAIYAQPHG